MTTTKKLRTSQQKALELCNDSNLREYSTKIDFYLYDLQDVLPFDMFNVCSTMILGDALAYLVEMTEKFDMCEINIKFLKSLYRRKTKTIKVTRKSDNRKYKIEIDLTSLDMSLWDEKKSQLWENEPL